MKFTEAFELMKKGTPVKLPTWGGYWIWDDEKETVMIHCRPKDSDHNGDILDIRETQRVEYTIKNILSDEWVIADSKNCPLLGGTVAFDFKTALNYTKRGLKVTRLKWNDSSIMVIDHEGDIRRLDGHSYSNITINDVFGEDWTFLD